MHFFVFVMDRIQLRPALCCRQDRLDFLHPPVAFPDPLPKGLLPAVDIGKPGLQIPDCQDIVLSHVIDDCHKAFKVSRSCFFYSMTVPPCQESFIHPLVKFPVQQIDQIDFLRLHFNLFNSLPEIGKPGCEFQNCVLQESDHCIHCPNLPVQVSDICADPFSFQRHDCGAHVHGRNCVKALPFIRFHTDTFRPSCTFKILILQVFPIMPPYLCVSASVPVNCRNLSDFVFPIWSSYPVSIFIENILLACFGSPVSFLVQGPHGQQNMEMRIVVGRLRVVNSQIYNHPLGGKFLFAVFPGKCNIVLHGKFNRKRDLQSPGKLRVPVWFRCLC